MFNAKCLLPRLDKEVDKNISIGKSTIKSGLEPCVSIFHGLYQTETQSQLDGISNQHVLLNKKC